MAQGNDIEATSVYKVKSMGDEQSTITVFTRDHATGSITWLDEEIPLIIDARALAAQLTREGHVPI